MIPVDPFPWVTNSCLSCRMKNPNVFVFDHVFSENNLYHFYSISFVFQRIKVKVLSKMLAQKEKSKGIEVYYVLRFYVQKPES